MATTLTVLEKAPGDPDRTEFQLPIMGDKLTVRELIKTYLTHQAECSRTDEKKKKWTFAGLFSPQTDNQDCKDHPKAAVPLSSNEQLEIACKAFSSNKFILLINDQQTTDLEQEIVVTPVTKVTFIRLVPLVGG